MLLTDSPAERILVVTPAMARLIELWPIDRLRPYRGNARTHSAEQVAQIAGSITPSGRRADPRRRPPPRMRRGSSSGSACGCAAGRPGDW
jgi:hypothetical protein